MVEPEFPPLLLSPCDEFVGDESLARVALNASKNIDSTKRCVLSAYDATNVRMLVSSVGKDAIGKIASTLAPWARNAWVIVLAFPNHAYAIDTRGTPIAASVSTKFCTLKDDAKLTYVPYKWSNTCNFVISMRMAHFMLSFKKCRVVNEMLTEMERNLAELKRALQSELESNEVLKKREKSMSDAHKSIVYDKRVECHRSSIIKKALARELTDVERVNGKLRSVVTELQSQNAQLRDETAELRAALAENATLRRENASLRKTADDADQAQLILKVAIQCHHYFTYDRYNSLHMRQNIYVEDGREKLPLRVLSSFPRLVSMCNGNIDIIKSACDLLDIKVDGNSSVLLEGAFRT